MKEPVTIDIETAGDRLLCIGYQVWDGSPATVVPVPDAEVLAMLADPDRPKAEWSKYDARWLSEHGFEVAGPVYDGMVWAWLSNENTPLNLEWCAMRYIHLTMDKRIRSSSGQPVFKTDEGREVPLGEAPLDQVMAYNVRDVETTTQLMTRLRTRLQETAWWDFYEDEHCEFTSVLMRLELRGLPVDLEASEEMRVELEAEAERLGEELHAVLNLPESFNLNSGPQLSALLFSKVFDLTDSLQFDDEGVTCAMLKACLAGDHEDCLDPPDQAPAFADELYTGIHVVDLLPRGFSIESVGRLLVHGRWTLRGLGLKPGVPTPSGDRPSTSSPALLTNFEAATHEWVTMLLKYRKMTKVLTTYLRKFPVVAVEGRVHGRFNQTGTVTGRLSSSEPNLQNIPAHGDLGPRVRRLFRAVQGTQLLVGDYSQLEPRLMAHFSRDPRLLDIYLNGKDIYLETAEAIFDRRVTKEDRERGIAKTYVLAMGYGAGAKKLQQILTINGFPLPIYEVERYLHRLQDDVFPTFFAWREATIAHARREGHVTTLSGQMRRLAAQFKATTWKARGYGERQAVNAVIQGSAGDVVRRTMLEFDRQSPELRMLAQVHDELVFEFVDGYDPNLAWVRDVADNMLGFQLAVPLVFEPHIGQTWYDAKEGTTFVLPEDFASPFEDEDKEVDEDGVAAAV
jgi:DNA polymerase I-like protein with 3'-5' exonuclease and polymerase domains